MSVPKESAARESSAPSTFVSVWVPILTAVITGIVSYAGTTATIRADLEKNIRNQSGERMMVVATAAAKLERAITDYEGMYFEMEDCLQAHNRDFCAIAKYDYDPEVLVMARSELDAAVISAEISADKGFANVLEKAANIVPELNQAMKGPDVPETVVDAKKIRLLIDSYRVRAENINVSIRASVKTSASR